MRRILYLLVIVLALALSLSACGGDSGEPAPAANAGEGGNAATGKDLYEQTAIGSASAPGCVTCHSQEAGVVLVGPSHVGIASNSDPGQSFEDYLRESILDPNAVITEGFTEGVMYQNYANDLSDQEVDDLVAYLQTLK